MLCLRPVANAAHAASSSARAREERGRARGGAARAMRRGRVCQARRGGGVAAQPARPRAVQRALGTGAVSGERGGESSRGGEDAGAHARHMRRRTEGLCQLTFPPRPISRVSSASLPCLAASYTASPIESLIAALELAQPICSARWWRRVLAARESGRRVA
jgi:hypothetical protein